MFPVLLIAAPHTIDVTAYQGASLDQRATSVAFLGTAYSANEALAPTSQTIFVAGR